MNFVFDIGNVLFEFLPQKFLMGRYGPGETMERLRAVIYGGPEWIGLDMGTISAAEATDGMCAKEPALSGEIRRVMADLPQMLTPIQPTIDLLPRVKEKGHGMYYLSNYHEDLSDYLLRTYPFFGAFDGGVFSCDVRLCKPDPAIYRLFLHRHGLQPERCVFFDDTQENIDAANALGMKGVLFTGARDVESLLES